MQDKGHEGKSLRFISDLVIYDKYSNYIPELERRQTWGENVNIVMNMHIRKYPDLEQKIRDSFQYVLDKKVMPSMRSIQYGGFPIELNPCRTYNCSYAPVDHPFIFAELFFMLLSGTGTGYSVRQRHIKKLSPIVAPQGERRFLIGDSIEGWADSIRQLIFAYMKGKERPRFDYRGIRLKGSVIRSGGVHPGFERLKKAHENIEAVLIQAVGRRLTDLECHDIICYQADCVLSGGIRDAAMISLFGIESVAMMTCKSNYKVQNAKIMSEYDDGEDKGWIVMYDFVESQPMNTNTYGKPKIAKISGKYGDYDMKNAVDNGVLPWYYVHPQRGRANNSVALRRGQVKKEKFDEIFSVVKDFGEPGFIWTNDDDAGFNPCVEISLSPNQFCNLTSVVAYDVTTQEELNKRVRVAAFIGTLQAGYTDFHYLRAIWRETTERDALLGVSMTGIASGTIFDLDLKEAAHEALDENEITADNIGINRAARVCCIKPEGSGTNAMAIMGSGIHDIHAPYVIRNVRIKTGTPLYKFLLDKMPQFVEADVMEPDYKAVVSIPMEAPAGSITRDKTSALGLLKRIKRFSEDWVVEGHRNGINTHNVSATVSVKPEEWNDVSEWMWANRTTYSGLSLLPYSGGNYKQAPFIEITKKVYDEMIAKFPNDIDFTQIKEIMETRTHASESLACAGDNCNV